MDSLDITHARAGVTGQSRPTARSRTHFRFASFSSCRSSSMIGFASGRIPQLPQAILIGIACQTGW
jgi:hypothetical protein